MIVSWQQFLSARATAYPKLHTLLKAAGHKYTRRWRGPDGEWRYEYPDDAHTTHGSQHEAPASEERFPFSEEQFASGDFDKNPSHWGWHYVVRGQPPIGWTKGGVHPGTKQPVKRAGYDARLYQIVDAEAEKGWAKLVDLNTGEQVLVAHDRVMPVRYRGAPKRLQVTAEDDGPAWQPGVTKRQPATTTTSAEGRRLPAWEQSTAKPGSALADIEGGKFLRKVVRTIEHDASGEKVAKTTERTEVDNPSKMRLIGEFEGMLVAQAKDAHRKFGLSPAWEMQASGRRRDATFEDLRMSAVEGFLTAIETYPGGMSFAKHAQFVTRDFVRAAAAQHFSGNVTLPERAQKLVQKYIAARAQAARANNTDSPTRDQVLEHWDVRKRDLHDIAPGDASRSDQIPHDDYKLRSDTLEHPGKREWAKRIEEFLDGRATAQSIDFFEESDAALPGVSIGHGLSDTEKADVRSSVSRALADLAQHTIEVQGERRTQKYRADTGEILRRTLGLTESGEGESAERIADAIDIESHVGGEWKKLGRVQKLKLLPEFTRQGLQHVRKQLDGDAGRLVERAAEKFTPAEQVPQGPTFMQVLEARSRTVTAEEVRAWRKQARKRWGDKSRANRVGDREARLHVAMDKIRGAMTPEMHRLMTQTITVDPDDPRKAYGSATMTLTDPSTGTQRKVRVATLRDVRTRPAGSVVKKSEGSDLGLTTGTLATAMRFPKLTQLLLADEEPTAHRFALESMLGLH